MGTRRGCRAWPRLLPSEGREHCERCQPRAPSETGCVSSTRPIPTLATCPTGTEANGQGEMNQYLTWVPSSVSSLPCPHQARTQPSRTPPPPPSPSPQTHAQTAHPPNLPDPPSQGCHVLFLKHSPDHVASAPPCLGTSGALPLLLKAATSFVAEANLAAAH